MVERPPWLAEVLAADEPALAKLAVRRELGLDAVQFLKDYSSSFYGSDPRRALRIAQCAHALGTLLPSPASALGRWALANSFIFTEQYPEAVALFTQARTEYLAGGDSLQAARLSVGLTGALAYTGQAALGLELGRDSAVILAPQAEQNPTDMMRLANLLMNIGVCHELLGQYEEALAAYERQTQLAQSLGNRWLLAQAHHNRAYALLQLNALSEALASFHAAEELFRQAGAAVDLARLYMNKGVLFAAWGQYTAALDALAQAKAQLAGLPDLAAQRHMLARVRAGVVLAGNLPRSPNLGADLAAAAEAFSAHGSSYEAGLAWLYLARWLARNRQTLAAQTALHRVLADAGAGRLLTYQALFELGQLAAAAGDFDTAITHCEQAIAEIEAMRQPLRVEWLRSNYLADKMAVYQALAAFQIQRGEWSAALAAVDQAKSRLLGERLAYRLAADTESFANDGDPTIARLTQALRAELALLDELYQRQELLQRAPEATAVVDERLQETIKAHEATVQQHLAHLQRHAPLFVSRPATDRVRLLQQHLASLPADTQLLEYFVADGRVNLLVANSEGVCGHLKLIDMETAHAHEMALHSAIDRVLDLTARLGAGRVGPLLTALVGDVNRCLHALYTTLVAPAEELLPTGKALLVAPVDLLHSLPFHAFHDGERYLIERRPVAYTPSLQILEMCRQRRACAQDVPLVMGFDSGRLVQVMHEMAAVTTRLTDARVLQGAEATTGEFLNRAPHAPLVHLAAHTRFRLDDPMLSSLALADRHLTLAEVGRLQLQADLIVLSGCETGRGRLSGADIISLAAGFLGAGGRSLVVSLWRVEDQAAARLMDQLYRGLHDGQEVAHALQSAQLALLRSPGPPQDETHILRHPAFWAPFLVIGDPKARFSSRIASASEN